MVLWSCSAKKAVTDTPKETPGASKGMSEREKTEFEYVFFNANKERILGNYELAANLYAQCIRLNPNEATPYYELANIYEMMGDYKMALEYSEKAVDLDKENYWYRILYAHSLQRNNRTEEAIKQYRMLSEKDPNNIDLYFDMAGMNLFIGKYEDALKDYNKIEEKIGVTEEVSIQKEKVYVKLGDVDKAADEIKNLIKAFHDEFRYYGLLADLYIANDRYDEAFEAYNKILEIDPEDPYVHLSFADYYRNTGDNEKSFEELRIAFKNKNLDIDTKVQILLSYYSITETYPELKEQAFELNKILTKVHPEEAKAYTIYGDFLYREKKLKEAKYNFSKAIKYDNSKFEVWSQLLFIQSELQDFDSILVVSKNALELFPNQPIFYFFYGVGKLQKKEYKEAVEYLDMGKDYVIDNKPLLAQFYANMGDAYNSLEDYVESDKAYDKALELEPSNVYVLNNYSYYLSLRGEKLEKAEEMSALSNKLEPNQANYQDTYAWVLYKRGKYEEALKWLEKALSNGATNNGVILEHLGDVYYKLNDVSKALEYWKQAKDAGDASDQIDKKIADQKLYE